MEYEDRVCRLAREYERQEEAIQMVERHAGSSEYLL